MDFLAELDGGTLKAELNGVYTDFLYEKDGKEGLWLEVIRVNAR